MGDIFYEIIVTMNRFVWFFLLLKNKNVNTELIC